MFILILQMTGISPLNAAPKMESLKKHKTLCFAFPSGDTILKQLFYIKDSLDK
jgi:hypothetical protein